jgi:flagellar hook assembly protein FlgD
VIGDTGNYNLSIYNSAGENIKNIISGSIDSSLDQYFTWDGKNKYGATCASGVYIIYATEPLRRRLARVVFIR